MSTPISPSAAQAAPVPHSEFLAAFQRLSKSGFQSSEFAAVLVALALLALAAWGGKLSPEWAAALGSALSVAYGYFRSQVKSGQGDQLLLLADIVARNPRALVMQSAAVPAALFDAPPAQPSSPAGGAAAAVPVAPFDAPPAQPSAPAGGATVGGVAAIGAAGAALVAVLLVCSGCAQLGAYNNRKGIVVSGGVSYDGASASVTRRPDGKTVVGVQVDGNELQRDLSH